MKKNTLFIAGLAILLLFSTTNLMAQGQGPAAQDKQPHKASPFLITGKLPHLTKLLMQEWDNSGLQLTTAQKDKLLVVRKETISGVKRLKQEIAPLEQQVSEGIFAGKTPQDLQSIVKSIAALKAEATILHLQCIYNTNNILDQQQRDFLMNL